MDEKRVIIIAGPNGAGKTAFARTFLPSEAKLLHFINADMIAAGLSPFAPEVAAIKAGRLMVEEINRYVKEGKSFALETTLSGHRYLRHIKNWQRLGYAVSLYFLYLTHVDIAIARVAARAAQGGHDIPEQVIRRRFAIGWQNFIDYYCKIVDKWAVYDNSGNNCVLLGWGEKS